MFTFISLRAHFGGRGRPAVEANASDACIPRKRSGRTGRVAERCRPSLKGGVAEGKKRALRSRPTGRDSLGWTRHESPPSGRGESRRHPVPAVSLRAQEGLTPQDAAERDGGESTPAPAEAAR